jgi:hypothetical protein
MAASGSVSAMEASSLSTASPPAAAPHAHKTHATHTLSSDRYGIGRSLSPVRAVA